VKKLTPDAWDKPKEEKKAAGKWRPDQSAWNNCFVTLWRQFRYDRMSFDAGADAILDELRKVAIKDGRHGAFNPAATVKGQKGLYVFIPDDNGGSDVPENNQRDKEVKAIDSTFNHLVNTGLWHCTVRVCGRCHHRTLQEEFEYQAKNSTSRNGFTCLACGHEDRN
jgi:hypothetical protein